MSQALPIAKSGSSLGREIVRGVLDPILGGRRR